MSKVFIKKEITPEIVSRFLDGNDPQERIVNFEYHYNNNFITIYYRNENDDKCSTTESFYPFLWAKKSVCLKLCKGNRNEVSKLLKRYGIWVTELDVTDTDGNVVTEMLDGYMYKFYALNPMSYSKFLEFFKVAGVPVYSKSKEEDSSKKSFTDQPIAKKNSKEYLVVPPVEQFMISTGKRMFKGYNDYDECLRLIFDLETTGLNTETDRIEQFGIRFNRPVKYKGEYITFEKTYSTEGETEEEKNASELKNIDTFLRIIYTFKPDIITGHNCEVFDWNILIGACKRLGTSMEEMSSKYFNGDFILKDKRETILKLGGEMEKYFKTNVPHSIITDSLHAVRRAQALDSNMLFTNLKYVRKYSKIDKPDRVYIPGDRISKVWNDETHQFAFNENDGDWYIYDPTYVRKEIKPDPLKNIEFFENQIIANKYIVETTGNTNDEYDENITAEELYNRYLESIKKENEENRIKRGKTKDNFTLYTKNELLDGYKIVNGKYIGVRYLLDDLWECDKVELRYNTPNFLICKMLPVPFQKCCTMGTAGQWKALLLAWSYENNLAIPPFREKKKFTGGLSRLLKVGFVDDVAKFDYNSLYPSIILTWAISDAKDLMHTMLAFLEHVLTEREKYKKLKKKAGKKASDIKEKLQNREYSTREEGNALNQEMMEFKSEEAANDKKQLPLKILGNSFFGSYGAPNVFPWGSIDCAERTTCTGRQALRLMIYWFSNIKDNDESMSQSNDYGYHPIVGDSVAYDTPILVQYTDGSIDIKPICEIFDDNNATEFKESQYRDFSEKDYKVLTRNGWQNINYVYKHKTNKQLLRIETKNGLVDCTEDHSLFNEKGEETKPKDLKRGDKIEIFTDNITYTNDAIVSKDEAWLYGFFMADGSSVYGNRKVKYFSKRKNAFTYGKGKRANWKISNQSLNRLSKAQNILTNTFNIASDIKDHRKSSNVYNLVVENTEFAKKFSSIFYTSYRYKKVPKCILNSNKEIKKMFLDGFCCGDGQGDSIDECIEFGQKSKLAMGGLYFILKELNYNFRCHNRNDKYEFISFRFRNHRCNLLNENYSNRKENEVWINNAITSKCEYVYDISADGTFVNILGMIVCHNTDGFNFKLPNKYRYTDERPYISKGLSRETEKDKSYIGFKADVAEFNDLFMSDKHYATNAKNKMGLGIDEIVSATINFSRKNYCDYFPDEPFPEDVKMVGNTIKSKKMPEYISKFLEKGIRLLLQKKGQEFIEEYYSYVENIYNYRIPMKQIASKGKIKKTLKEYIIDCNTITKAGRPKSRQAWMELALRENLNVNMGETLYYINIGKSKSHPDVKKVTHYYMEDGLFGDKKDMKVMLEKEWKKNNIDGKLADEGNRLSFNEYVKKHHSEVKIEEEVILNCKLIPREIIESENDIFCEEGEEYNVPKYMSQFNNRITPLLVCFKPEIRDKILINTPSDRLFFTDEECELCSGFPNKEGDQDTFEQLMTMEDKEIKFWLNHPQWEIPYLKECNMDWDKIVSDYNDRMNREKELGIKNIRDIWDKTLSEMSYDDFESFEEGELPSKLEEIVMIDPKTGNFVSKEYPDIIIGTIYDIFDAKEFKSNTEEEEIEMSISES